MTPSPENRPPAAQPDIAALMARFLGRQSAAHAAGPAVAVPGDVEPYEAVPVQAGRVPAEWTVAWANETAALQWHRGEREQAARSWQALPESVPVLFNRGMAALFLGRPVEARAELRKAVERLPESSGWHHLGRLYLALAGG